MSTDSERAVAQIDAVLKAAADARARSRHDDLSDLGTENDKLVTMCAATVQRLAPTGSPYRETIENAVTQWKSYNHLILPAAVGALEALKADYEAGNLASLPELIHAELFADFLEMAEHLLGSGYKDAAAVIAGSTLEGHLRQLAAKTGSPSTVTAWLGLRNDAAHGSYGSYEAGQVGPMIAGIRDFIRRRPA